MPAYRIDRYILMGQEPILCEDLATWTAWMETPHRLVRDTQLIDAAHNRAGNGCLAARGLGSAAASQCPTRGACDGRRVGTSGGVTNAFECPTSHAHRELQEDGWPTRV